MLLTVACKKIGSWFRKLTDQTGAAHLFTRWIERSSTAAGRLRVRSALNPILWLCAIGTPICVSAAFLLRSDTYLSMMFAIVGIIPIIVACLGFIYFAIVKPEQLRSEEYQIKHDALLLIKEKGSAFDVSPSSIDAIANPYAPQKLGDA